MTNESEVRISTLVGDRLCIRCGYNLVGQPIVREGHYEMLIVRCPECATVASVQEYPLLGRWANRWAALLAGLWLLILVGLWIGTSMAIFGFCIGGAEIASDNYRQFVYEQWQEAEQAAAMAVVASGAATAPVPPAPGAGGAVTLTGPGGQVILAPGSSGFIDFQTWWKAQDKIALLAQAGGWRTALTWWLGILLMWMAIVCTALGCMWATVLLARGRAGLIAWAAILIATSAAVAAIPTMEWLTQEPYWYYNAAISQMGPIAISTCLLWGFLWLSVGMLIGRSVTRGLVRLMLPPRMRSSLAFVWLADGKEPPGETSKRRNVETSK